MHSAATMPMPGRCAEDVRAAIVAAARVTCDTGMATAVLVARQPEIVARARDVARRLGVQVVAEVDADGIEVRFGPGPRSRPATPRSVADSRAPSASLAELGPDRLPTASRHLSAACSVALVRLARCLPFR